ncbi:MAG: cellulase family glycosylhydrolase, partial [bacterium]
MKKISIVLFGVFLAINTPDSSQAFLKTENKNIVNGSGEVVILRGMGLGGWMLMEGYMMQTASFASPQHKIREKIVDLIGETDTDAFFNAWLANHCRKIDIDSLAAWGFNSVRLPLHYNLFTLPIEDEPVPGSQTWLDKGFNMVDSLLSWCAANEMYLILDLHAAPGGQGHDAAISDYDDSKPSLWESSDNQAKTVALWRELAERYADEPWIGGYDLINETNWNLPGNSQLKQLYELCTLSIRAVDKNHIIFIEGNWFANDFTGLTPPFDNNMAYSFHKYWSYNDQGSIQWMINLRNQFNIPIWCGESGENSNVWFTDAIKLFGQNNIGWAWWPMKKIESISGPLSIKKSPGYQT